MNKFYEPNCDMLWDVYLDWLADQGFDDLRNLNICNLVTGETNHIYYHNYQNSNGIGNGETREISIFCRHGDGGVTVCAFVGENLRLNTIGHDFSTHIGINYYSNGAGTI